MPTSVAWPSALGEHLEALADHDVAAVALALDFPVISPVSAVLRRTGYAVSAILPAGAHRVMTTGAKMVRRVRTMQRGSRAPGLPLARLQRDQRPWDGRRAAVLLTHDIDTPDCFALLEDVLCIEREREVTSVVNVLTHGPYPVTGAWLADLRAGGVDVGLHGATHDYAIGSRSSSHIERHLARALEVFGEAPPVFYRAPAFNISARLARLVARAGFRCDSSRTVYHPGFRSTESMLPFRPVAGANRFWELPVAVEDSLMFREWRMDATQAIDYCDAVLRRALESGGVLVLDTHPGIVSRYPDFYRALLDSWIERDDVWVASGIGLLDRIDELCAA